MQRELLNYVAHSYMRAHSTGLITNPVLSKAVFSTKENINEAIVVENGCKSDEKDIKSNESITKIEGAKNETQMTASLLDHHDSAEAVAFSDDEANEQIVTNTNGNQTMPSSPSTPTSTTSSSSKNAFMKKRNPFTDEEIAYLKAGYVRFGHNWRMILNSYPFNNRTNVDLKDKARNLIKHGLLPTSDST